jgi:hypothetical protein
MLILNSFVKKGNVTYKSTQICAYADDITVIARNTAALKELILDWILKAKKWD